MHPEIPKNENRFNFSVSMCVYGGDRADWFKQSVDSILNQSLPPNEVVLVVDGPISQELNDVVLEYEKRTIFKVIRLETNQGHGNARRIGLEACTYDLVALMDADDISCEDRFERQIEIFRNDPTLSLVGGNIAEFIDTEEKIIGNRIVPMSYDEIIVYLKKRCPFNQVTVMFKKVDVENVGGYLDWYCEEDYYLWVRMYLAGMKFQNIPLTLCKVRVGKDMYNRRGGWKYFKSEAKFQKYMKDNKVINSWTYFTNVIKRFIIQVLLPNKIRGWVFKKFARSKHRAK